ncbi:MAG: hypothetical protein ACREDF_09420, partial [Thermoplasmata archaeon]
MSGLPCPNCGSELAFLAQYQRHYCYSCGRYAPDGFGDRGAKRCPTCTGILSFVAQYERYYCYRCSAYPPEGMFMITSSEPASMTSGEPVAASPPTVVVLEPEKVEEPKSTEVEIRTEQQPEPEPLAEEEIPAEEAEESADVEEAPATTAKPLLDRQEILEAKKPILMDLCKAYDLDPTGTKEQLRERLLSYLEELEGESPTPEAVEAEPQPAQEEDRDQAKTPRTVPPFISAYDVEIPRSPTEEEAPWVVEESNREEPLVHVPHPTSRPPTVSAAPVQTVFEPFTPAPIVAAPSPSPQDVIPEASGLPIARTLHPCPRCGRELTYISQYDRWYCYSCRTYAPRAKAKFACPTCGASLRWISQYERWWCDSCRRYAPSDLPKPERALTV